MKRTLIATTLIGLLAVSGAALAKPGGPGGMFKIGRLFHGMELTEAQEDAAIAAKKDVTREARKLRESALESLDEVAIEVKKPKPDAAKLHGIADQRIDELRKTVHYAIDRFLTFHQTLTPQQRQELGEQMEKTQRRVKKWESE